MSNNNSNSAKKSDQPNNIWVPSFNTPIRKHKFILNKSHNRSTLDLKDTKNFTYGSIIKSEIAANLEDTCSVPIITNFKSKLD